jgi:hypothetical protein
MKNLNYLDLLKERQMDYLPVHFSKIQLTSSHELINSENILNWVRSKLSGRFFLAKIPTIDKYDRLKSEMILAFEDKKELTFFILACPFLRRN